MSVVSGVATFNVANEVEDEVLCKEEQVKNPTKDCESNTIEELCNGEKPCQDLTRKEVKIRMKNILKELGVVENTELFKETYNFLSRASSNLSREDKDALYESKDDELKRIYSILLTKDKQIVFDKNTKMSLKEFVTNPSKREQFKKYREQLVKNSKQIFNFPTYTNKGPNLDSQGRRVAPGLIPHSVSKYLGLREGGKTKKTKKIQKKSKRSTRARGRK